MKKEEEEKRYEMRILVSIREREPPYGSLEVEERVYINADSFMEIATILSAFHTLAKEISEQK